MTKVELKPHEAFGAGIKRKAQENVGLMVVNMLMRVVGVLFFVLAALYAYSFFGDVPEPLTLRQMIMGVVVHAGLGFFCFIDANSRATWTSVVLVSLLLFFLITVSAPRLCS